MSITCFSLANKRLVLFIFFLLSGIGLALYPGYPSQEEPTLPINITVVTAYHQGLDVYQTEALLARPIERALQYVLERFKYPLKLKMELQTTPMHGLE
jgi:multidrug efflux pump